MLTKFIRMLYQLSKEKQKIQEQCKTVRCLTALKASTMDPHSRWITTACGYLRLLIFGLGIFGVDQKKIVRNYLVYYMRLHAIFYAYPFKANSIRIF